MVLISFQDPASPQDDTGTWTPLKTNLAQIAAGMPGQQIDLNAIHPDDLRNPPPEVDEIVKLVAKGYGIPHWSAAALLEKWLLSYRTKGVPRSGENL